MPDLPERPSLEHLRKQAKRRRRDHHIGLARAQHQVAAEYGFASWPRLVRHVQATGLSGMARAVALADPDRLAQALDNLVVNTLAHGAGTIELVARAPAADSVELAVADRGPGFAGELLPRAFERFAQGSRDTRGDGTGLGLAIVAALATALGGSARAANRPGGGAEVVVSVPAA